MNHYNWLEQKLPDFFEKLGIDYNRYRGYIVSDGDEASFDLHYYHGIALYLLTNNIPFSNEVRNTANGWVSP